jgi:hypothetical protein
MLEVREKLPQGLIMVALTGGLRGDFGEAAALPGIFPLPFRDLFSSRVSPPGVIRGGPGSGFLQRDRLPVKEGNSLGLLPQARLRKPARV